MTAQPDPRLQQQEPEYRAIFEASSDGLVINDAETGTVLEANPAFCRMHGYERMIGLHPTTFIHPDTYHLFGEYVRTIQAGKEFRGRARDVRRDGTIFDVEVRGRGLMYQGRFAMLGVVRDVTEQVRAYQVLEQRVAQRTREVDRRRQVAEALRDLMAVVNSQRTLDQILAHVAAQASELLGSHASAIYVPVHEEGVEVLRVGASSLLGEEYVAVRVPVGMPATGLAFARRRPVAVYDIPAALAREAPPDETLYEDRTSHLRPVHLSADWKELGPRENDRVYPLGAWAEGYRAILAVPLAARDETYGTLTLYYREAREFAHDEVLLATAFADQAALAIENARLHAQLEQRLREQEALYRADEQMHRSLQLNEVLRALVDVAAEILASDSTCVLVWDATGKHLVLGASHGLSPAEQERMVYEAGEGIIGTVAVTGQPRVVEDVELEPDARPRFRGPGAVRSGMHVPIMLAERVFGVFAAEYRTPRTFSFNERRLLLSLAQRAGLAIQNARLHEESEQRRRELEALYHADAALHRSLRLDEVLQTLVDLAAAILRSDVAGVWTLDAVEQRMIVRASHGMSPGFIEGLNAVSTLDEGTVARDVLASDMQVITSVRSDPRLSPRMRQLIENEDLDASVSVPLRIAGQLFGIFAVGFRTSRSFGERERRLLVALGNRAALAIENARLYEQAQQSATLEERQRLARELHDAVTQTLFSTALIAEVIPELWDLDPAEGRQRLQELRRLTRGALAEMRTLLVELRPGALTELPLGDLLRQLGEATAGRTRLEVNVEVDPRLDEQIPAEVRVSLYRIAQEALNNTVKHAQALRAGVRLAQAADGELSLLIEDDGKGFDPTSVPAGHLGVEIMRERAQAIGAALRVVSGPHAGTRVEVSCRRREEAAR